MFEQEGSEGLNVSASGNASAAGRDLYNQCSFDGPAFCPECRKNYIYDHERVCPPCAAIRVEREGKDLLLMGIGGWIACSFAVVNVAAFFGWRPDFVTTAISALALEVLVFAGLMESARRIDCWLMQSRRGIQ